MGGGGGKESVRETTPARLSRSQCGCAPVRNPVTQLLFLLTEGEEKAQGAEMAEGADPEKDNFWSLEVWQSLWSFQCFYFCSLFTACPDFLPSPSPHTSPSPLHPLLLGCALQRLWLWTNTGAQTMPPVLPTPSLHCGDQRAQHRTSSSGFKLQGPSLWNICHRTAVIACSDAQSPLQDSGWAGNMWGGARTPGITSQAESCRLLAETAEDPSPASRVPFT